MCNKCNMNIKEYDDYFGTDKHLNIEKITVKPITRTISSKYTIEIAEPIVCINTLDYSLILDKREIYMNKKLYNTLCELTIDQLVELQVTLNIETRETLNNLYNDLHQLISICNPHQEYHSILVNELYNFLSGEDLETMTDSGIPEKVEPKIDYMASIREACGR